MHAVFSPMKQFLCRFPGQGRYVRSGLAQQPKIRVASSAFLAAGIATGAWKLRALSPSGAVAALLVGTSVHAGLGFRGSFALLLYVTTATALGRLPKRRGPAQQRGNRRDAVQVLANGGPATLFSILHACGPAALANSATSAFYGSVAAAAADTWATEVGTRWGGLPRSLTTGRKAAPGESGAITPAGFAASLAASVTIAAVAPSTTGCRMSTALSCAAGGIVGSVTDSLLGALVQEQRWCNHCGERTELKVHPCGGATRRLSGVPAVNNDAVNLLGVVAGGLTAVALSARLPCLAGRNRSRVEFALTLTNSRVPRTIGAL